MTQAWQAWRAMAAVAMLLAAASILLTAALYDRVQDERQARVGDQAQTFRVICERQEITDLQLIDQSILTERLSKSLRRLILAVTEGQSMQNRTLQARQVRALNEGAMDLRALIVGVRRGIRELERGIERVDCANLPANRPFER